MLPILQTTQIDILRYYRRAKLQWARHLGEETQLDFGVAICNPKLELHDANRIFDAFVPQGSLAREIISEAESFFASQEGRCQQWTMSASADPHSLVQLENELMGCGFRREIYSVMRLAALPPDLPSARSDLQILPARASFRHARQIAEESAAQANAPHLADASMMHLDDPHWDALIALKDGDVAGRLGVLSVGEIGLIENVFVSTNFRRQGVASTLLTRGIEICQRSQFRHVLLGVSCDNAPAISLYHRFGFTKVVDAPTFISS